MQCTVDQKLHTYICTYASDLYTGGMQRTNRQLGKNMFSVSLRNIIKYKRLYDDKMNMPDS